MKFIILLIYSFSTIAFICPNIRLDKSFSGNKAKHLTMQSIPVQHQKLGICYSYAATQLVDAVRAKRQLENGKSSKVSVSSPVFTAMMSKEDWDKEGVTLKSNGSPHFPFEGGHLCNAFNKVKLTGTCSRKKIEAMFGESNLSTDQYFKKLYEIEERLKQKIQDARQSNTLYPNSVFVPKTQEDNNLLKSWNISQPNPFFLNQEQLKQIQSCRATAMDELFMDFQATFGESFKISYKYFKMNFSPEMFNDPTKLGLIFRTICPSSERDKVNTKSTCSTYKGNILDKYAFTKKILKELESDSLPVGISYCAYTLTNKPPFRGITSRIPLTFKKDAKGNNKCGNHASLVIGSRWNKKADSCELLVRNTWGTGCSSYKKGYPAASDTVKGQDVKCESGNIWIDYKELEKNIYRVQHL